MMFGLMITQSMVRVPLQDLPATLNTGRITEKTQSVTNKKGQMQRASPHSYGSVQQLPVLRTATVNHKLLTLYPA